MRRPSRANSLRGLTNASTTASPDVAAAESCLASEARASSPFTPSTSVNDGALRGVPASDAAVRVADFQSTNAPRSCSRRSAEQARHALFRAAIRAIFFFFLAVRARGPPTDATASRRCSARPRVVEAARAAFAKAPVLADSRTAREGGFAGAVRRGASRSGLSFFLDELPLLWPGRGFPKRVPAFVAVFYCACVDKDR